MSHTQLTPFSPHRPRPLSTASLMLALALSGCGVTSSYRAGGREVTGPKDGADALVAMVNQLGPDKPRLLKAVAPAMPAAAIDQHLSGPVEVSFLVDAQGRVSQVTVIDTPHALLGSTVVAAIRQWQFEARPLPPGSEGHAFRQVYQFVADDPPLHPREKDIRTTSAYQALPVNADKIRALGLAGIAMGRFEGPASFSALCRMLGPLKLAGPGTHVDYIRDAFAQELQQADAGPASGETARVVLSAQVRQMAFATTIGMTGGSWLIDLDLTSSNGQHLAINTKLTFDAGFEGAAACNRAALAFGDAVQRLVRQAVAHPSFAGLLK